MIKTYAEKRFFEWVEDDVSVSLRNRSGSYGGGQRSAGVAKTIQQHCFTRYQCFSDHRSGGGEGGNNLPIILQSNQNNAQVYEDEETCPTLVASMGCGGGICADDS